MGVTTKGIRYIDPDQPIRRVAEYQQAMAEDVDDLLGGVGSGVEMGFAESSVAFSTADSGTLTTWIPDLIVPVVGTGRPCDIRFFAPNVYHDVVGAIVTFYFVVDGAALTVDGQVASVFSPQNTIGPSCPMERRIVLGAGVEKTFRVGMLVGAGGWGHIVANAAAPMQLAVTSR